MSCQSKNTISTAAYLRYEYSLIPTSQVVKYCALSRVETFTNGVQTFHTMELFHSCLTNFCKGTK